MSTDVAKVPGVTATRYIGPETGGIRTRYQLTIDSGESFPGGAYQSLSLDEMEKFCKDILRSVRAIRSLKGPK